MTCQIAFESHIRSLDGDYNLFKVGDVYIDVETQIEWRTWQKAWQAALASQDDGWVEWAGGGNCPVNDSTVVEVKCRSGSGFEGWQAKTFCWTHIGAGLDIIAYRVVKP